MDQRKQIAIEYVDARADFFCALADTIWANPELSLKEFGSTAEPRRQKAELDNRIATLRQERKEKSDRLQQWLFDQYSMLNARGERCDLTSIFAATPQRVPPSGAGDCCAPKLLQYAYLHGLHPVCMAEFWWGKSPKTEIRHHLHYYPACRSKYMGNYEHKAIPCLG